MEHLVHILFSLRGGHEPGPNWGWGGASRTDRPADLRRWSTSNGGSSIGPPWELMRDTSVKGGAFCSHIHLALIRYLRLGRPSWAAVHHWSCSSLWSKFTSIELLHKEGSFSGGPCSPPLAGNGPNEPLWLSGPLRGGFCALGLPGLGFIVIGCYSINPFGLIPIIFSSWLLPFSLQP